MLISKATMTSDNDMVIGHRRAIDDAATVIDDR